MSVIASTSLKRMLERSSRLNNKSKSFVDQTNSHCGVIWWVFSDMVLHFFCIQLSQVFSLPFLCLHLFLSGKVSLGQVHNFLHFLFLLNWEIAVDKRFQIFPDSCSLKFAVGTDSIINSLRNIIVYH